MGYARFGQGFDTLSSFAQGADGGRYTVRGGDTLASVAQALWGDANLWYKLAQANGLGADSTLIAGQTLAIPAGVIRTANSTTSTRPYDAADLLGDLSPTTPAPQATNGVAKKNKCGAFGAILLIAVAVAVTVATKGVGAKFAAAIIGGKATAASAGAVILGGALSGAAGSVVSQGVGLATGLRDNFSFKAVALAGIAGGVGGAIGGGNIVGSVGGRTTTAIANGVVRGALGNLATQGLAVATGLQSKFDWAGVAVGAAVGGAISGFGEALGIKQSGTRFIDRVGQTAAGLAGAIAGGAARSLIDGSSFGDNVLAALPDVIGSTIGNALGDRLARGVTAGTMSGATDRGQAGIAYDYQVDPDDPRFNVTAGLESYTATLGLPQTSLPTGVVIETLALPRAEYRQYEDRGIAAALGRPTATSSLVTRNVIDGPNAPGLTTMNMVSGPPDATQFFGGVLGYYRDGGDGTARFIRLVEIEAMADRMTVDLFRPMLGPVDTAVAGYRIAVNREYTLENGLAVGGAALGSVLGGIARIGRVAAETNVWKLGAGPRGEALEKIYGQNLPSNFPVIDRFKNGLATSIKSIDLDGISYLTGNGLKNRLTQYVDKVAAYEGTGAKGWASVIIRDKQISARGLDLIVPHNGTGAQQQILSDIIKYGASRPNPVRVKVIPHP